MERHLIVPFPPSLNSYYRMYQGRLLISKAGREYRKNLLALPSIAKYPHGPFRGSVGVLLEVYQPDRRKRDLDNMEKCLLDGLTKAGVWLDDSQIDDLHIRRLGVDKEEPRVLVHIESIKAVL